MLKVSTLNHISNLTIIKINQIPITQVEIINGVQVVKYPKIEIHRMYLIENLQYAIIGKFSHGLPKIEDIRKGLSGSIYVQRACWIGVI